MNPSKRKLETNNFKYLKLFLEQKKYTLKDLKCEVVLMICYTLIEHYLLVEENEATPYIDDLYTVSDVELIFETINKLQTLIYDNILTIKKIQILEMKEPKTEKELLQYKLTKPLSYFFNIGVNRLKYKLVELYGKEENVLWIPELIAITIINDLKDEGYNFQNFKFLNEIDFESIFNIYNKTNILMKKKKGDSFISKENKTIIDNMQNISNSMVISLINSKYK